MCGLSAFISFENQNSQCVKRMTDTIRHRGPDDEGYAFFGKSDISPIVAGGADTPQECYALEAPYAPDTIVEGVKSESINISLGHRRLSILDVSSSGHQPMCSTCQNYWIVYNGEVYNYLEIRAELESLGFTFNSGTDTEVILAAFIHWGDDCLQKFNGMFSFLIFNRVSNRLFVARDRFGVKPLYYWVSKYGIAFASEIKQFTVLPGWEANINGQRAYDFLKWGVTDHTNETMFDRVYQLRGGEAIDLSLNYVNTNKAKIQAEGTVPKYQWYVLKPANFLGNFTEATAQFTYLLKDSISLRMRSDVPVGSCLSGGLDSSSIVCIMNSLLKQTGANKIQKTFSSCSELKKYDERDFIDDVVGFSGVDAHYVYPKLEHLLSDSNDIVWYQDEPYGSTSIYAQWSVFKLSAKHGVKVMLDGQGADEQLAGYTGFIIKRLIELFWRLDWVQLARELDLSRTSQSDVYTEFVKHLSFSMLPRMVRNGLSQLQGRASTSWIDMNAIGAVPSNPYSSTWGRRNAVDAMSISQLISTNLPMLLHWEDRDSMCHSIEARVPYLDYRLVEFVLSLPSEFRLSNGLSKRVLRDSMRGFIPETVRNRTDKMGFVTAEEVWMRKNEPELFKSLVAETVKCCDGINPEAQKLAFDIIDGNRPFSYFPWRLISYGEWYKKFNLSV